MTFHAPPTDRNSYNFLGETVLFREIDPASVPAPIFPDWNGMEMVGLSPRQGGPVQRLAMNITLPLPNIQLATSYARWHAPPHNFLFELLDLDHWQRKTGSNTRMFHSAFRRTGMPPLFWGFQIRVDAHLEASPFRFAVIPQPESPSEQENFSEDDSTLRAIDHEDQEPLAATDPFMHLGNENGGL